MSINPSTFLSGPNAPFIEELYARYLEHPETVDPSWRRVFADLQDESETVLNDIRGYETATIRQIVHVLRQTYCGNIGVEYMHIQDPDQRKWLQLRIEGSRNQRDFTDRGKIAIPE